MPKFVFLAILSAVAILSACSTKNYVRQQTQPVANKVNELDDMTAKNTHGIKDVDQRTQAGIQGVQQQVTAADQKAAAAAQQSDAAQSQATGAINRASSLESQVANLDNFQLVTSATVNFGFNKDVLTPEAEASLDQLAAQAASAKHYIVSVEGGADAIGGSDYNYALSQRRANAVIQYLAGVKGVPPHKFYVIGMGKDKPVASNTTDAGRAQNRRVEVKLLSSAMEPVSASAAGPLK